MSANTTYRFSNNQAYWPLTRWSLTRPHSSQSGQSNLFRNKLAALFQSLVAQMTDSSEPRVWQSQDTAGRTLWNAYDGTFNRIIRNASETELRDWLEHRYQL